MPSHAHAICPKSFYHDQSQWGPLLLKALDALNKRSWIFFIARYLATLLHRLFIKTLKKTNFRNTQIRFIPIPLRILDDIQKYIHENLIKSKLAPKILMFYFGVLLGWSLPKSVACPKIRQSGAVCCGVFNRVNLSIIDGKPFCLYCREVTVIVTPLKIYVRF